MASNSILKLQVDDKQYEASLKSAQQGLQALMNELRNSGKSFSDLDKNTEQYVRALGNMEATAKTTRGRIGEMSSAFVELSQVEKQLTDQERQSPVGKALAASLDQLKTRIQEGKSQLDDINKSINGGGGLTGALDSLSDKFGMSVQSIAGWGTALAAGKAALDVAKDAFFASELSVDEWGRTVAASQSLYEGFLTAINNGDISGYLSRMDEIVQAARAAYNELDTLGTMKTIQAPKMSAQQTENERFRMMIQTGRYIAPIDGRKAFMQDGQLLTPAQIKTLERQLQNGMQNVVKLVGNEVKQTGKAIDAYYNSIAKQNGMSLQEFKKGTSSWDEFSKKMQGYQQYQKWRQENSFTDMYGNRQVREGNPYQEFKKWGTFRVDKMGENSFNDLVQLIQQRDQQAGQAYSMQSQAFRTMNRAEGMTVSKIMRGETAGTSGGGSRTGGKNTPKVEEIFPEGSLKALQKEMQEMQDAQALVTSPEEWQQLQTQIDGVTEKMNALKGVTKEVPMATGFSGLNTEAIGAYQSMLQSAMKSMDFGSEELAQTFANSIDATTLGNLLTATFKEGIDITKMQLADGSTIEDLWDKILGGENIPDSTWESLQTVINEKLAEMGIDPIKLDFKTGEVKQISNDAKEMTKDWNSAASAIQSVGQAMSQIEDPAAKVMGTIAQAIATIALTFAKSLEKTFGPWDWIAAAASGTATMISTISAIHSATGYAEGGIVKGNQYSGDNIWTGNAWVNSGELILNRAQQGVLADALSEPPSSIQGGNPYVSGENIFLGMNNYLRRAGYGELVTTKR